jgi:hypothetical protein
MASIKINNLANGFDLFNDSESYMNDISTEDLQNTLGGSALTSTELAIGGGILIGLATAGIGISIAELLR